MVWDPGEPLGERVMETALNEWGWVQIPLTDATEQVAEQGYV